MLLSDIQELRESVQLLLTTKIAVYLMTFLIVTVAWAAHIRWARISLTRLAAATANSRWIMHTCPCFPDYFKWSCASTTAWHCWTLWVEVLVTSAWPWQWFGGRGTGGGMVPKGTLLSFWSIFAFILKVPHVQESSEFLRVTRDRKTPLRVTWPQI